ncbi:hypothetical protein DGMP_06530 [Desulfomarina profundi]|uniref:Uncharacterized protein n=1 Tax=Desulfomarina profundi TaxID=2772557 RepID=A0A8D5JNC1_9BACT|nr:hypothetical protein [Desulfomarina profundi]BCL59960.1 hypothetical protein DGMP_06530 [Desulfomarina profundi]
MSRLTELRERKALYIAKEKALLEGLQSWTSQDGMANEHAALRDVRAEIKYLDREIALLDGSGFAAQPCFFPGR